MSNVRTLLIGFTVALATITAGSTTAHAARRMLVLIDASGSMGTPRPSDAAHPTRFDAAKALAEQRILEQDAVSALSGVAVYTFSDFTSTLRTPVSVAFPTGFVPVNDALDAIDALDLLTAGGGSTPLAGSMCDAINTLVTDGGSVKILQVSSDGLENSTLPTNPCAGPDSLDPEPFTPLSWQNLVLSHFTGAGINVRIDLFDASQISFAAPRMAPGPDDVASEKVRAVAAFAAAAAAGQPPTLEEFFAVLARVTGGSVTLVDDNAAVLPVYADMNADNCVNRSDALLLARQFGQLSPPADGKFDLSTDGKIGFADYQLLLNNRTPGCGAPDPYVSRAPIVCTGGRPVVIDGQSIESGAITIDARVACAIVIKNSLIVSGKNAINVLGTAIVTVDNSILVGENAVLSSTGATLLSAANSVFHGPKAIVGALVYVDRGGNTWE